MLPKKTSFLSCYLIICNTPWSNLQHPRKHLYSLSVSIYSFNYKVCRKNNEKNNNATKKNCLCKLLWESWGQDALNTIMIDENNTQQKAKLSRRRFFTWYFTQNSVKVGSAMANGQNYKWPKFRAVDIWLFSFSDKLTWYQAVNTYTKKDIL